MKGFLLLVKRRMKPMVVFEVGSRSESSRTLKMATLVVSGADLLWDGIMRTYFKKGAVERGE
jgi:hypothetical protein